MTPIIKILSTHTSAVLLFEFKTLESSWQMLPALLSAMQYIFMLASTVDAPKLQFIVRKGDEANGTHTTDQCFDNVCCVRLYRRPDFGNTGLTEMPSLP